MHALIRILILSALTLMSASVFARSTEAPISQANVAARSPDRIEQRQLAAVDRAKLLAEDVATAKAGTPMRFAVASKMALTPQTAGTWEDVAGGRLWRLRVTAPGATDLNFGFTDVKLPVGAKLWLVSEMDGYFQGPYTAQDNKPHGIFYSPVIPGNAGYVELFVPKEASDWSLRLVQVARGYRDLFKRFPDDSLRSGSCNNDTICPEGDDWRDEIRSVARYSNAGLTLCTGQLVMDTDASFRNLFLSAFHCGITPANAATVVLYWNYESPTCGQLGGGSLDQNQTGTTYLAGRADVDFLLLELDADPLPEWNVYWAGWDNSGTAALGTVGIHHPSGDEKAISFNFDAITTVDNCASAPSSGTHWEVNNWEDGTTEGGSSGSGLWDPVTHLIVGTLTGGGAACGNNSSDCYGKLSVSWSGLAAPERLQDHLDPGNTGATQMAGGEPSDYALATADDTLEVCGNGSDSTLIDVTVQGSFSDPVTLSVGGLPAGASGSFSANPVSPPGSSVLDISASGVNAGSYGLTVTGTAGSTERTLALTLNAANGVPAAPTLLFPADGATGVTPLQKLYWSAASNASTYRVELAADSSFTTILETSSSTDGTGLARSEPLADNTTYYWRVVAQSPCGDTVSASASFTTGAASCQIFASTDVPQAIPLIPGSATSTLNVSGITGPIGDVNVVDLNGTHTYINDIDFALSSPSNTLVQIMSRSCGNEDNFDLNLDDQAAPGAWPCPPVGGGTYKPSSPLAAFLGESGDGTWTLTVTDSVAQDGGSLEGWGLEICFAPPSETLDSDGDGVEEDADNCRLVSNPSQCDTNGDGFGNHCDADINNNGVVNIVDLGLLKDAYLATPFDSNWNADADLNCSDVVNTADLGILKTMYLGPPGPSGTTAP